MSRRRGAPARGRPRDGFQNEPEVIATDDKVRLIELLARTGVQRLELTSFVRADVIPQLADAARGARAGRRSPTRSRSRSSSPTSAGWRAALELREHIDEVNVFLSASETHNRTTSTARSRSRWAGWSG